MDGVLDQEGLLLKHNIGSARIKGGKKEERIAIRKHRMIYVSR